MAWIESHQSLSRHRKTLAVVAELKVDRHKLIGHLHELWWWALDNATAEGALGQIQLTHSLFASMVLEYYRANPQAYADVFHWPLTGPQPDTYSEPSVAGGGHGHLQVTHSAALLLWLTDLKPSDVCAFVENFELKVDLCDAISVRFEGGAIGTVASSGGITASQTAHQQHELLRPHSHPEHPLWLI